MPRNWLVANSITARSPGEPAQSSAFVDQTWLAVTAGTERNGGTNSNLYWPLPGTWLTRFSSVVPIGLVMLKLAPLGRRTVPMMVIGDDRSIASARPQHRDADFALIGERGDLEPVGVA